MGVFDNLRGTLDKSVAAVSVKSEAMVETSRTKTAISAAQKKLENQTVVLGAKVYSFWKNGQTDLSLVLEDLEAMQVTEEEILALNNRLEQIKEEENRILGTSQKAGFAPAGGGVSFCSNCGKKLAPSSRFCDGCGTPVSGVK